MPAANDENIVPSNKPNQLRIIGGAWRSRKLSFPDLPGLRPSPDRVRETLFNWLAAAIPGARCLDLFAGSGVLGLEAASRGAAEVVMVEWERAAVNALHSHVNQLNAAQVQVWEGDALTYLRGSAAPFDVVFIDPPFGSDLLQQSMLALQAGDWLYPGACIYLEAKRGTAIPLPEDWDLFRSKTAGQVDYQLVQVRS
ncbi:MAG: 16S rRNA (guanine(966)-N(2))-methyltransferase RsmD [Gammaproteobacteria bacterium]